MLMRRQHLLNSYSIHVVTCIFATTLYNKVDLKKISDLPKMTEIGFNSMNPKHNIVILGPNHRTMSIS